MRLLLDTHIVLWALADDTKLSNRARLLIEDRSNSVFYSSATTWEVAIKHAIHPDRMLISGAELVGYCKRAGFVELPVAGRHVCALETLRRSADAPAHNDPFDRIMLSQAKADNLLFISHDSLLDGYGEDCLLLV